MWPRRRSVVCGLFFALWGLCSSWASPTSGASTSPPGSVVLSDADYSALLEAMMQAQEALADSSKTITQLSQTVEDNSSVIAKQSEALTNSSSVIAEQERRLTRLSNACVVLGTATGLETAALLLLLLLR